MTRTMYRTINVLVILLLTFGSYTNAGALKASPGQPNVGVGALVPTSYYVNPTGNDSNPGTAVSPFKTLSKGVSVLLPGDSLIVIGTFHEKFNVSKSGTSAARINYVGQGAVIDTTTDMGIAITASYVNVSGFEVEHVVQHGLWNVGQHNIIQNNIVHDSVTENGTNGNCTLISGGGWASGISIKLGSDDVTVRNNQSYNNCGEGLAVTRGTNVVVEGNNVHDNFSVNIYIDNSHDVTVQNNTATCTNFNLRDGNRATGIADGAESYSGWGYQRYNNYFYQNTVSGCYDGIAIWAGSVSGVASNIQIKGNVIPTGIRRSISIASSSNQNVVVQDNQIFAAPYVPNPAGVTLLNNVIIGASPTATKPVSSPTKTAVGPSATPTFTSTLKPTFTKTSTSTFTSTPKPTFTKTSTSTFTSTPKPTFTKTSTSTFTSTPKPTFTKTLTSTFTSTPKPTNTSVPPTATTVPASSTPTLKPPTSTATHAFTATPTQVPPTSSPTAAIRPSATFTPIPTNTNNPSTSTPVSPTALPVTFTFTPTSIPASTATFTPIPTFTTQLPTSIPASPTSQSLTFTPIPTFTNRPSTSVPASPTQTATISVSSLLTDTPTLTSTSTPVSPTALPVTFTPTSILVSTATFTPVPTNTTQPSTSIPASPTLILPSFTPTATISVASLPTDTPTLTATPTTVPFTFTPTASLMPAATNTPVPTNTTQPPSPIPASPTPTLPPPSPTDVPFTFTPTDTPVPTFTDTPVPPTPIPPSPTATVPPPTPTTTSTPIPPPTQVPPTSIPASPTTAPKPTAKPGPGKYFDDKDGGFDYSTGWTNVSNSAAYDGSYKVNPKAGASVTFHLSGQSFSILYTDGDIYRRMSVYVDGVLVDTVLRRTESTKYQQRWDYSGQLSSGEHTLKLVFANGQGTFDAVIVR